MVTTHVWNNITLMIVACLSILLHVIVMHMYGRRFRPTTELDPQEHARPKQQQQQEEEEPTVWSGVHLILKHNYVLLILGASCLYEVSLTCLNYQMTVLGYNRYEGMAQKMTFTQFMGHYGQLVNVSSLLLSSMVFPFLIRRFGLRHTLRLFPTLLLVANFLAFGPFSGNLALLFVSLSMLKAMTFSIHDPAKEILYLPTSNAIKFKAKFWIDVVGARVAKAIGSGINKFAGSVDRSIQVASAPSLLTAAALWYVCYRVGSQFDHLVETRTIVGMDDEDDDNDERRTYVDDGQGLVMVDVADDDDLGQDDTSN
jgi:AAA family ATP:ADP antiporter